MYRGNQTPPKYYNRDQQSLNQHPATSEREEGTDDLEVVGKKKRKTTDLQLSPLFVRGLCTAEALLGHRTLKNHQPPAILLTDDDLPPST